MNEAKQTPGPWTQGHSAQGRSCVWLAGHTEPSGSMGECQVWIDCNTEANARLIAAAPELLEALRAMIDAERAYESGGRSSEELDALEKAHAAITKATGRADSSQGAKGV